MGPQHFYAAPIPAMGKKLMPNDDAKIFKGQKWKTV
jgi:hypothetical protein